MLNTMLRSALSWSIECVQERRIVSVFALEIIQVKSQLVEFNSPQGDEHHARLDRDCYSQGSAAFSQLDSLSLVRSTSDSKSENS